jgi:hypothetical protein
MEQTSGPYVEAMSLAISCRVLSGSLESAIIRLKSVMTER